MFILILEDLYAIMQYVACVKLVGIELATSLPVQYDIGKRSFSSWTRYRRGEGRVSRTVHVRFLCPPAMSTACVSTFTIWSRNSLVVSVGSVLTAQERHSMRL